MKGSVDSRSRSAHWRIPLVYAASALGMALVLPRIEHHFLSSWVSSMSAAAAMAVCSTIASGMIALTGIVFSLSFVMVQFSATAYSPRLVLWLARDPVMAHALGMFTATFLYALGLLGWVDRGSSGAVPLVSGYLVLGFLLASMGMFVALIERIGMLQVNRMLIFTGDRGRRAIEELYSGDRTVPAASADAGALPLTQTVVHHGRPQALQGADIDRMVRLASEAGAVIELAAAVGDTVFETAPLLRVYSATAPIPESALRGALRLGDERTFEQDPKYGLRLVVDIAIKALSSAINDPTTAVQALDQVEDLLLRLGRHRLDRGGWCDSRGQVRFRVPLPSWEDFLLLGLDEIRAYGADSVQVMRRMMALIKNLQAMLPAGRQPALRHWHDRLRGSIARSFDDAEEKRDAAVADRQGLGSGPVPKAPSDRPHRSFPS